MNLRTTDLIGFCLVSSLGESHTIDKKQFGFAWLDSSAQLCNNLKSVQECSCELNTNLLQQWNVSDAEKTVEDELRADLVQEHGSELSTNLLQQ